MHVAMKIGHKTSNSESNKKVFLFQDNKLFIKTALRSAGDRAEHKKDGADWYHDPTSASYP